MDVLHKSRSQTDQTQSIPLYSQEAVEIFKRVLDDKQLVEIMVTNKSDRQAHVTVSEDISCKDVTIVAPGTSTPFDLMGTTKHVFVSVVLDANGQRKEVCRDRKFPLNEDKQPEVTEMNVHNKNKQLANVTVSEDRGSSSVDYTKLRTGKSMPFGVKGKVIFLTVVLDPSGEICRDHPCSIGRSVTIKEDGTIQLSNAK